MVAEEIIDFLRKNIEPLDDSVFGPGYRASVFLTDGTFLPCVMFRNAVPTINLAVRRFKEELSGKSIFSKDSGQGYKDIVKVFVTAGNCINDYDIEKIKVSASALPLNILQQIKGETTMGWTGFVIKMKDGNQFGFGTRFRFEFFKMPDGYSVDDIEEIINHSYISTSGELFSHEVPFFNPPENYDRALIYRERPFFECYIDNL